MNELEQSNENLLKEHLLNKLKVLEETAKQELQSKSAPERLYGKDLLLFIQNTRNQIFAGNLKVDISKMPIKDNYRIEAESEGRTNSLLQKLYRYQTLVSGSPSEKNSQEKNK